MKKLFTILSLTCINLLLAQTKYTTTNDDFNNYHQKVSSANRMYKNDSLLQAYAQYDLAFDAYTGNINPSHYFKAALCALKIKEEFKALKYLEKAITGGYIVDSNKVSQVTFFNKNTKQEYDENVVKWTKLRDAKRNFNWESDLYQTTVDGKKYNATNYKVATEFCVACLKNPKCVKSGPEYSSKYRLVKEKMKFDSINAVNLLDDIKKFGFPNLSLIDKQSCETARNILLNYDLDKKNERLNEILYKALTDGYISPAFYAKVVDRRNLMNGLTPEFYEPITGYEKTIGKDLVIANSKRKTIGLYNIILPKATIVVKPAAGAKTKATAVELSLYDY